MRLDSFQSFTPQHPPEHLGPILARNRFDGSIAACLDDVDPRAWLEMVRPHDFVKAALPRLDLDDASLTAMLDDCARWAKFRGVYWTAGDSIPRGVDELQRRGLTLDVQLKPSQIPLAIDIAKRFPHLPLAILHLGSPDAGGPLSDDWASGMAALARFPQVVCKASDLIHLASGQWSGAQLRPYMQHVLAAFSPSRLMFGSGWPAGLPDHIWKETLAAFTQSIGAQSMEVREEMLGGVAARVYGVKQESEVRSQQSE